MLVNESEVELSSGETVQIGDHSVTILEVDGDVIHFRIDSPDEGSQATGSVSGLDMRRWIRPR